MPSALLKPTASNELQPQPACGATEDSWEFAVAMARSCVHDVVWSKYQSYEQREQIHWAICSAVETYVNSLIHVKKRRAGTKTIFRREFVAQPLAAVEALKRLLSSNSCKARARAWTELPMVAMDALRDAAFKARRQSLDSIMFRWPVLPGTFVSFDATDLSELVPVAIEIARGYGNRNFVRDQTLTEILRQFARVRGTMPSAKESALFVADIQSCYVKLLPKEGFNFNPDSLGIIYRALAQLAEQGP
jgi:hypothetical protein